MKFEEMTISDESEILSDEFERSGDHSDIDSHYLLTSSEEDLLPRIRKGKKNAPNKKSNNDDMPELIKKFAVDIRETMSEKLCKYHDIKYNLTINQGCKTLRLLDDLVLNSSLISTSIKIIWSNNTDKITYCHSLCDNKHHKTNMSKKLTLLHVLLTLDTKMSMHDFSIKISDVEARISTNKTMHDVWCSLNMDELVKHIFKKEDYQQCACVHTLESFMKTTFPHFFGIITCNEYLLETIFSNSEYKLNEAITNDDIFLLTKDKFIEVGLSHVSNVDNYIELICKLIRSDNKMCKMIPMSKFKLEKIKFNDVATIKYPEYIYYVNNNLLSIDIVPEMYVNKHTTLHKIKMLKRCQPNINAFNQHIICINCASYGYICGLKKMSHRSIRPKIDNHVYHFMKMIHNIVYHLPLIFDIRKHIMVMYNHVILEKIIQKSVFY